MRQAGKSSPLANLTLPAIRADPDHLTAGSLNSYLNAIHAIGRQGTITVEANESSGDRVKIVVTDSGKGIAAEQSWRPFYALLYNQS